MASFNKVVLLGNLTRDVDLRYAPSGSAIAEIGLAVNHRYKDSRSGEMKEEVTFIDITFFGRTAEVAQQYLAKGRPVLVEGRLKFEQWADRDTGAKRSKLKVIGETLQLLGGRDSGRDGSSRDAAQAENSSLSPDEAIAAAEETPF